MECPRCGSENVTHSHRRGIEKLLRFVMPRVPYRCKECWSRFWKFHNPLQTMSSKIIAGTLLLCLTAVAIVLVLSNGNKTADSRMGEKKQVAVSTFDTMKTPETKPPEPEKTEIPTPSPKATGTPEGVSDEKPGERVEVDKKPGADEKLAAKPETVTHKKPDTRPSAPKTGTRTLTGVRQIDVDGDFGVIVTADRPITNFTQHFITDESPPKFYIDLPGKWKKKVRDRAVKSDMIYNIRFGKHADYLRIVFDLKKLPVYPDLKESGEGMIILLRKNK